MMVRDLIKALSKLDPETEVEIPALGDGPFDPVEIVAITEPRDRVLSDGSKYSVVSLIDTDTKWFMYRSEIKPQPSN